MPCAPITEILFDAEHRLVMYYLANKNPRIDESILARGTRLPADKVRAILSDLQSVQLARFEQGHGYTLTDKGLAGLYNWHVSVGK